MKPRHRQGLQGAMSSLSRSPLAFSQQVALPKPLLPSQSPGAFPLTGATVIFAVLQHEVRCADREKTVQGINTQAAGASGHPVSTQPAPALFFGVFPVLHTSCFCKG